MKWFRWYRGACSNPKLAMVAELADNPGECGEGSRVRGGVSLTDVIAVWAVMLEDAAHKEHWGVCKKPARFIASMLRWHSEEVQSIIDRMADQSMIEVCEDGIKILNWHEYQYTSDGDKTGAERQRRYYDKHKRKPNAKITEPNALASRPDTDTDTDTERKKDTLGRSQKATRPKWPEEFKKFLEAYPRRLGANPKRPAEEKFNALVKQGVDPRAIIEGAKRCAVADADKIGTPYIPQAVKWLRDRRWEDYSAENQPPAEGLMSAAERDRLFAELRKPLTQRNPNEPGNNTQGNNLSGSGTGPREDDEEGGPKTRSTPVH